MLGRKLLMLQNGEIIQKQEWASLTPLLEEWKHSAGQNLKRFGYALLVTAIRLGVRSSNLLKNKYQEIKTKIRNARDKNQNSASPEKKEVSKFLRMISEYKQKVREIKRRVKEEENL